MVPIRGWRSHERKIANRQHERGGLNRYGHKAGRGRQAATVVLDQPSYRWALVASMASERELSLRRVEEALRLIKQYDARCYFRITRDLKRIWVNLVPDAIACYQRSLQACVLDERYVLSEKTTPQRLALTIIHEATHARLERCGLDYELKLRPRIEAVCLRRELAFVSKLPNGAELRDELVRTLEWSTANPDYYSNLHFEERWIEGEAGALRYLGAPEWNMLRRRFAKVE
jgi:hypothetical protein